MFTSTVTATATKRNNLNFFKFSSLLVSAVILCALVQDSGAQLSFNFGHLSIFNIPAFASELLGRGRSDNENVVNNGVGYDIDPNIIEDSFLKTPQLIKKYGYAVEVHHVTTEDEYILELHRIPNKGATPVLLAHGLLDSSATWVIMGPNKGLAYLLADLGYDVWMTNVRGNTYSRNHTKFTDRHSKFWDFSFHEIGKYDLPASIDYVLNATNHKQLHYIGHSQGTVTFWIMCSERPEYSDKIILMQALAPVAFIKHCKSPVVEFLAFFQEPLTFLLRLIGQHEFLPGNEFVTMFNQLICDEAHITQAFCSNVIFLITGFDKAQMNETMLPVMIGHAPAGASTKQMQHYGQLKRSGAFRQFDYGWILNHWRYNSISPPEYKLEHVRNKVVLHYSLNDWLASIKDVNHLAQLLPNMIGKFQVDYEEFNHLDFVWGINVRELLYKRVVELLENTKAQEAKS